MKNFKWIFLWILFVNLLVQAQDEFDLPPLEPPYVKDNEEFDLNETPPAQVQQSKEPLTHPSPIPKKEKTEFPVVEETPTPTPILPQIETKKELSSGGSTELYKAKGLYRIDQSTGTYYYKTEVKTKKNQSMSLRFGSLEEPSIFVDDVIVPETGNPLSFADIYSEGEIPLLMMDYEWKPFESFRQLHVQLGAGLLIAEGNGVLLTSPIKAAKETYTFIGIPLNAGLTYRLQFADTPLLAPYVSGGLSYFVLGEIRNDGKDTSTIGTPAAYGAGGLLLNISRLDKETAFVFDREYNIHNLWLALEFRYIYSFDADIDMSSQVLNLGVTVDY